MSEFLPTSAGAELKNINLGTISILAAHSLDSARGIVALSTMNY